MLSALLFTDTFHLKQNIVGKPPKKIQPIVNLRQYGYTKNVEIVLVLPVRVAWGLFILVTL